MNIDDKYNNEELDMNLLNRVTYLQALRDGITPYEYIAELAGDGCTAEIVKDFVEYDGWDNADEHAEWLDRATPEEIADWIAACRK